MSNMEYYNGGQQVDQRIGNTVVDDHMSQLSNIRGAQGYEQAGQVSQPAMSSQHAGQQLGAGEPAQAGQQDSLHTFLDKIEKKFGGERFNNPNNLEKNRKLNDSLIAKLKRVMSVVIQRAPQMVMSMMR